MKMIKEVNPQWGEYYIAIVSITQDNPKHKIILFVDSATDNHITYTPLTYEGRQRHRSDKMHYFELVEKLDMDYKGNYI